MADLFGKKVKTPTVQKVEPAPTVSEEAEDYALKTAAKGGFATTFLAGDLIPTPRGKTTL